MDNRIEYIISKKDLILIAIIACVSYFAPLLIDTKLDNDFSLLHYNSRGFYNHTQLVLNGFLGIIFNNYMFGVLNVLILKILFDKIKNGEKNDKLLMLFIIGITVIISVMGYYNFRYMLTLHLFYISILVLNYATDKISKAMAIILSIMIIINIYINLSGILNKSTYHSSYVNNSSSKSINKLLSNNDVKIFSDMISEKKYNNNILNNNLPELYYYSNAKMLYMWINKNDLFTRDGIVKMSTTFKQENVTSYLRDTLKVQYIVTTPFLSMHNQYFVKYLNNNCTLLESIGDYQLYKINEDNTKE